MSSYKEYYEQWKKEREKEKENRISLYNDKRNVRDEALEEVSEEIKKINEIRQQEIERINTAAKQQQDALNINNFQTVNLPVANKQNAYNFRDTKQQEISDNRKTTLGNTRLLTQKEKDNFVESGEVGKGGLFNATNGALDDRSRNQKRIDNIVAPIANIGMGMESVFPSIANYENAALNKLSRLGAQVVANKFTDKDTANTIGNIIGDKIYKATTKDLQKDLETEKKWRNKIIESNTAKTTNIGSRKLSELAPSLGQNIVPMAVAALPVPGARAVSTAMFMTSAAGNYLDDAKERGMNDDQALGYATIMGLAEGGSESLVSGNMVSRVKKAFTGKALSETFLNSLGTELTENFAQEASMEPFQELMAQTIGGEKAANWDNIGQRTLQAGFDGILSALLLKGTSMGIVSSQNVMSKIENNQTITDSDINNMINDLKRYDRTGYEQTVQGAVEAIKQQMQKDTALEQQLINQENKVPQNGLSEQLPVSNGENSFSNKLKEQARQEIQNSKINAEEKRAMLEALDKVDTITEKDINDIRQTINNATQESQTEQNKSRSFEDIAEEAMFSGEYDTVSSPLENRNINTIGQDRNVNAYQYDNPEVKPYYQEMAKMIGVDLGNISSKDNLRTMRGGGTTLSTNTAAIEQLHNGMGYSYEQIKKGLDNIIEDNGKENNAVSKKLEIIIDDQLRNGYRNSYGRIVDPNQDYINLITRNNANEVLARASGVNQNNIAPTAQDALPVVNKQYSLSSQSKDSSQINQEVLNYIKKNNLKMTADEFMEWASNKQLEQEDNMTPQQQELYSLIRDVQNRTMKEEIVDSDNGLWYNDKGIDFSNKFYEKQLDSSITTDTPRLEMNKIYTKEFGDNFYLFEKISDGKYNKYLQLKIEGNEELINSLEEAVKNGEFTNIQNINEIVDEYRNRDSNSNGIDSGIEEQTRENGQSGRFYREESESDIRPNSKTGNENSNGKIENSNRGSFSMQEDTSDNTTENEVQRKINRSMTMEQAKDMVQRAFVTGNIYEWFDGEYKNGDEWLAGEGADAVAMVIDNDYNLQNKYVNANSDILNDEYIIDDVIEAYQNGTLTGKSDNQVQRLDTSKSTNYEDTRFYAPKDIDANKDLYNIANQRVTNANRQEVYKARADFILNAHNEGYIESIGLTQKEVNEKLRSWTSYPKNAMETSKSINEGVASENRWTGIENCSVVNELSVTPEQLNSMVKEIKGVSNDYQRRYISNTMLAIDTHMDYKNLIFDFAPDASTMRDSVLGDYQPDYDIIRVKREGQNTVSHEMGHYIDHLIGRELGDGYNLGLTRLCRSNLDNWTNGRTFTSEQKQFIRNFANFLDSIEDSSDIGSSYKMSSDEVFARFVARFTEWTRNTATGNRYGYEAKWYDDKFTTSQFKEFAKLLQEYSLLKTTGQAAGRSTTLASQRTGKVQDQRIDDIYSELYKDANTAPTADNNVAERARPERSINYDVQSEQNTIIDELPISDDRQKFRKHYDSIMKSQYTTDEARAIAKQLMKSDTYIPESNNKQLERADTRIKMSGADSELNSLMSRSMTGGNIKADDIAVGERLIQYYSKMGDKAKLQEAIQATAMAGTTAGQTVQAMSLLNHQTPEGQAVWLQRSVEKINNDLKERRGANADQFDLTPEMTEKIVNSKNAEELQNNLNEVYEELGQQVSKSTIEKIDAWRYFSMLANPRTHIRNIVGNVAMGKVQTVKNKVAGVIEGTISKFNPDMERTHTIALASKEVKQFAQNDIANVADRLELNDNKYNPKTRLENSMRTFKHDAFENTLGKLFEFNNKALEAEDAWGLKAAYKKSLAEYMTANKLNPDTITDKQLAKARNYAVEQAKEATFHQASALATALNQFSNKNGVTKFISDSVVPFKKTPINVAKAGIEYSPVGLAKSAIYDTVQLRKGNITVNQYIDNVSKGLTGTGVALLGYALAEAGILKASGTDDKDKESYDQDRGKQTYSIQIGDNTYSLDWLAPTGIPLFIGAEVHEIMQQEKESKSSSSDEDSVYNQALNSAMNIVNSLTNAVDPMTEMSMLSGLTSTLKSYDNNLFSGMAINMGKSYVNQFVPTALGQIAKTTDEYQRSTTSTKKGTLPKAIDSTKNQIMAKIPGLRQMLPTKTDIWGNEQKQSENILQRGLENAVFPWTRKGISTNNVDRELETLYKDTGESSVLPDSINRDLTIDKQKYVMTSEEYARYKKQYGEDSYKILNNLVSSSQYKKMNDSQKQKAIEKVYEYAKEQIKIDYAKNNKLTYDENNLSKTVNSLKKANANVSNYFEYIASTQDTTKTSEKLEKLTNSNYSKKTKQIIYENSLLEADDEKYPIIKNTGLDIDSYLKYKIAASNGEFAADIKNSNIEKARNNTVTGSGSKKAYNYIMNMQGATYMQKIILYGLSYSPKETDKQAIANYIVNMEGKTYEERKEMLKKFSWITIYNDGSYDI